MDSNYESYSRRKIFQIMRKHTLIELETDRVQNVKEKVYQL